MIIFPDPMPYTFPPDADVVACVQDALESCADLLATPEGKADLLAVEGEGEEAYSDAASDRLYRAREEARERFGADVEVTYEDGGTDSLYLEVFYNALFLGVPQVQFRINHLNHYMEEADARVLAGVLTFENMVPFENSMLWVHALYLAGAIDADGNEVPDVVHDADDAEDSH